jgi:hypothetical protein
MTTQTTKVMTEPQFKYLIKLTGMAYASDAKVRAAQLIALAGLDFAGASTRIDELKAIVYKTPAVHTPAYAPKVAEAKVIPAYVPPFGSYMIRGVEVEIKKPKYSWGSPSVIVDGKYVGYVGQSKANAAFSALQNESDALSAVIQYAKVTHKCGVCHTKLTDPKSIAAGIGPVCAKKYGYKI